MSNKELKQAILDQVKYLSKFDSRRISQKMRDKANSVALSLVKEGILTYKLIDGHYIFTAA